MQEEKIDEIIAQMIVEGQSKAYEYSDQLIRIGGQYILDKMVALLQSDNDEIQYLASRTLGLMEENDKALEPLFEAINDKKNKENQGMLSEHLEEYDCSEKFVQLFKLYLFGSVKASAMAKNVLDYEEFDITPRVIKKAEKAWSHYVNNVKQDETFDLKKEEIDELLGELKAFLEE